MTNTEGRETVRLLVEYDGSGFSGFQKQPDHRTVQGELEEAVSRLAKTPTRVFGAGRTDAGVHASGQVVHFSTPIRRPMDQWVRALNDHTGDDLAVVRAQVVSRDFHARFSAKSRRYRYRLLVRSAPSPLRDKRVWWMPGPVSFKSLSYVWQAIPGRREFGAFAKDEPKVCQVLDTSIREVEDEWWLEIEADRFRHGMVRGLVGAAVWAARGWLHVEAFQGMLEGQGRTPFWAPAQGLNLMEVRYPIAWD